MKTKMLSVATACLFLSTIAGAAEWGLRSGAPEINSANTLAFGPDGILFVGDTKSAAIFALDTGDADGEPAKASHKIEDLRGSAAELLGVAASEIQIRDLAVNPASGNVYLAVQAKDGASIVRVESSGKLSELSLTKIPFSQAKLADAPNDKVVGEGRRKKNLRDYAITDLAYHEGKLLISGLNNSDSPSSVREIDFPFADADRGASVEIYHGAHGRYEDGSPIQTFIPFTIDGKPNLLAGFTCTPLVKFPIGDLKSGDKIRGTTIAELGNHNKPLDMIVYKKGGQTYLLMANTARGVMKISTADVERTEGITDRIQGTAGQEYETIDGLKGVMQLDRLNDSSAVVLIEGENGNQSLQTIELP